MTSDAFARAWDEIHRSAHTAATSALTGEGGGALEVKGDTITLNVGTVIEELQEQLIGVKLVEAADIPLDAVTPVAQSQNAAAAVYDTLARFLRQAVLTALLTALLAVIAWYLYGRGRGAVAVRSVAARSTETAGHGLARTGLTTGAVGQWLGTHRPLTTGVVIGAGGLTLFLWNYPTTASVALLLLLVVVVLVIRGVPAAADGAEQHSRRGRR